MDDEKIVCKKNSEWTAEILANSLPIFYVLIYLIEIIRMLSSTFVGTLN
jgi:hypothetical protein